MKRKFSRFIPAELASVTLPRKSKMQIRKQLNIKQSELAEKLGVSDNQISILKTAKASLNSTILLLFATFWIAMQIIFYPVY